ncbi:hypothetical protein ES332_A04G066500v1 [Gossypium tomentosum]|uniref:Uncharacterized protein n=1 Tax=Gossypium tomentosum TaxID=34277 RepID=A0A5D2QZ32_GOSTO|nr:hypothetical protein ES332_A04G066500v1 [Gossypium tomentosum]
MATREEETCKKEEEMGIAANDEEDDEHDSKERVLQRYFLQEWKLVKSLLDDIVSNGRVSDPSSVHKIRSIMDKYQEQGQLLEPYLESMVSPLMFIIRSKTIELGIDSDEILQIIKPISIIIYSLVTVSGYKAVINTGEMEAKCVMLLWLSILVLVPFDISSVDTSIVNSSGSIGVDEVAPLVLRIIGFSKDYLSNAGPMRTMAGLVLSKLLTRPDMPKALSSFIEWTQEVLSSTADDVVSHFQLIGAVEALAAIFKAGSGRVLLDVVPTIWNDVSVLIKSGSASRSPLLRKYLVKLTQRIGLTCLPHRLPTWRYVGRTSSLGENISLSASNKNNQLNHGVILENSESEENSNCPEDEDMDVPEIVEEVIEDTVVRWSAAKGIGRVTSRLTSGLSEEVLSSVLELFAPGEGDGSWHGGCLALAELARRGLLLPSSLPKVVPVVIKALHYDVRRGPHSVGSHVRDAAAYVCWAFGRAYHHTDMRNVLEQLSPHLLSVACYDREVNCRRAAAAAFQENVGRQGNYPHGIDIVNTADYFSLSSRTNSYIHVATCIAQYEGYLHPFVDELLHSKISHWDRSLRELATEALAALVRYDAAYFADFVLEKLIPFTLSSDLCTRHGATLAAGELVLALHQCGYDLPNDKQKQVSGIVPAIEKARLYRGKGGEIMRLAVSRFIECISFSRVPLPEKVKRSLIDSLNENLRHPNSQIQTAAVKALKHFVQAYLVATDNKGAASNNITLKYLQLLNDSNVAVRRGSAMALGVLPYEMLANQWKDVILKLCSSCAIEDNPEDRDAEARVNAVKGLVSVCETLAQERESSDIHSVEDNMSLFHLMKNEVMVSLFKALEDYSVDNRGDVGSWVREAAMEGLERCTYILCKRDSMSSTGKPDILESMSKQPNNNVVEENQMCSLFDVNLATNLVGGISKQAVEKMDKLRELAAKALQRILYHKEIFVPFIPYRENIEEIVPNETDLKWGVPTFSYPRFVQLLKFSCYSRPVLSGLVISIGGLQDSLRKASLSAFLEYLNVDQDVNEELKLCKLPTDILWILQQYKRCDRVIIPTLKVTQPLDTFLREIVAHTSAFCSGVLDSLAVELKASKDFSKLYAGIAILGYICSVSDPINARAFSHLLTFLTHRYPKIRKATAEQVYLVLLQNGSLVSEEKTEKALEIVSETCWDGDMETAKVKKLEVFEIVGLDVGVGQSKTTGNVTSNKGGRKSTTLDENESYSSLVESSGF